MKTKRVAKSIIAIRTPEFTKAEDELVEAARQVARAYQAGGGYTVTLAEALRRNSIAADAYVRAVCLPGVSAP
jgi:hypothetical protein